MIRIEHIGIASKNLKQSNHLFEKILGKAHYKIETVESEGVNVSFFKVGETKIELLEGINADNSITRFIDKKGEGIHHIAFLVEDIQKEIERLVQEGFQPIMDKPKKGADNKMVFFFHPKSTNGILIELCQHKADI